MMWVHLFDAHRPYAPKGWDGDPYRGEIAAMDVAVGRLLDAVGEQSLVVVAGDHGENLWDGQELEHGLVLTRSVLRVPLILRPPGGLEGSEAPSAERPPPRPEHWRPVPEIDASAFDLEPVPDAPRAARVIDTPVSLVDLAATMLDYAGGAPAGRSLRALVEGRPLEPLAVYAETLYPYLHYGWAPGFFACSEERVLLRTPSLRSIQPTGDPWWQAATGEEAPLLAALIDQHGVLDDMPGESPDEEEIQRLAALGYSTLRVRSAEDWEQLPDAADRMTLLHRVFVAQGKMASDPAQAEEELLAALAHDEGLVDAWYSVASLRVNRLDREGALEALDRLLESAPTHLHALRLKLALLRALERHEEALAVTELLLSLTPLELQAHREVVATLLALERDPTSTARAGLEIDAQDCYLNHTMGVKLVQSDPTAALEHLERVRAADCPAQQTHLYEGLAYRALGQVEPALSAFAEQAKLTPQDLTPVHYQVELLLEVQDCERALALLETLYTNRRDPETLQKYRDCGGTGF